MRMLRYFLYITLFFAAVILSVLLFHRETLIKRLAPPNIGDYIYREGMYSVLGYAYKENIVLGDTLYLIDSEDNWHYFIYISNNKESIISKENQCQEDE